MDIKISTEKTIESERLILLLSIALTVAIKEKAISIEEAENFLFSPYSIKKMQGLDSSIIDLIKLGCELEDVESLMLENLDSSVDEIYTKSMEKLKELEKAEIPVKKWID